MTTWHDYDDANHVYANDDAVAVLDGREMLGEWTLTHPTEGAALVRLWENGEDVHVWYDEDGKGFGIHPHDADSIPDGWGYIRDELLAELEAKGYAVTEARVSPSLTDRPSTEDKSGAAREAEDYERPSLAEQLRAVGAEQAARDAEDDAAAAERAAREADARDGEVEHDVDEED